MNIFRFPVVRTSGRTVCRATIENESPDQWWRGARESEWRSSNPRWKNSIIERIIYYVFICRRSGRDRSINTWKNIKKKRHNIILWSNAQTFYRFSEFLSLGSDGHFFFFVIFAQIYAHIFMQAILLDPPKIAYRHWPNMIWPTTKKKRKKNCFVLAWSAYRCDVMCSTRIQRKCVVSTEKYDFVNMASVADQFDGCQLLLGCVFHFVHLIKIIIRRHVVFVSCV